MMSLHHRVTSSMIKSVAHDPDNNTLEVKFTTGSTYRYKPVTEAEHDEMIDAPSVGKYFNDNIRERELS